MVPPTEYLWILDKLSWGFVLCLICVSNIFTIRNELSTQPPGALALWRGVSLGEFRGKEKRQLYQGWGVPNLGSR